jgi:hypothetical protein
MFDAPSKVAEVLLEHISLCVATHIERDIETRRSAAGRDVGVPFEKEFSFVIGLVSKILKRVKDYVRRLKTKKY